MPTGLSGVSVFTRTSSNTEARPVPHYCVAAHGVEDIPKRIGFASARDKYLVIKFHDHGQYVVRKLMVAPILTSDRCWPRTLKWQRILLSLDPLRSGKGMS